MDVFTGAVLDENIVASDVIWLQQSESKNQEREVPGVIESAEEVVASATIWEVGAAECPASYLRIDSISLKKKDGDESSVIAPEV